VRVTRSSQFVAATKPESMASSGGQRLWRSVAGDYGPDVHEELLLIEACRCADRLDRLAKDSADAPLVVTNSRGDQVSHPSLVESRQQQITLSRLLASLRLPSGEETGRPQRRGASRGSYGIRGAVS
jgi:hypothetical protein